MWRLRPLIFLPASYPRVSAETVSAPLTDWESTIPADGTGLRRSSLTRTRSRSAIVNTIKGAVLAPVAEVPPSRSGRPLRAHRPAVRPPRGEHDQLTADPDALGPHDH